jgi:hypothetical protein
MNFSKPDQNTFLINPPQHEPMSDAEVKNETDHILHHIFWWQYLWKNN